LFDTPTSKRTVEEVLRGVCGVQAQVLGAAQLSIRARSKGLTVADAERAQLIDRTAVWTWCMRATLHLIASDDVGVMLSVMGPEFVPRGGRRLAQLGLDHDASERGVRIVRDALASNGPSTRAEVGERLKRRLRKPFDAQAVIHLLARAALEGTVCRGPSRGKRETYVLLSDWTSVPPPPPAERALAHLARRYVEGFGPARPEDFAAWSGLPRPTSRTAWNLISDDLAEVAMGGDRAWILTGKGGPRRRSRRIVRLVPNFDTYLLGYENRELTVEEKYARRILRGGGWVHPVVIRDGRAVATWRYDRRDEAIIVEPFGRLDASLMPLLDNEVNDIGRFLGTSPSVDIARDRRRGRSKRS
jgi:Winged helix DNA-binding domain